MLDGWEDRDLDNCQSDNWELQLPTVESNLFDGGNVGFCKIWNSQNHSMRLSVSESPTKENILDILLNRVQ